MTQPPDPTTGPTSEPTPEPTQSIPTEPTQSIPTEPTEAVPTHYAYPGEHSDPGTPAPAAAEGPAAEGVSFSDDSKRAASGRRTGLIAGGLVALLAVGGGIAFGVAKLSGGGAQPADVIPADAIAYVRLDIDPSAGQKVAAVRFLSKFPGAKDVFGSDDMRKGLWEQISKQSTNSCFKKFNFDKDIAPWLGDRAGVALRPGKTGGEPNMVFVVQTSDEAQAKDTLAKLAACNDSGGGTDVRTRNGYAVLTPKGQGDAALAALDKGSLASNSTFTGDMSALGDQGVASMWFDAAKLAALAPQEPGIDPSLLDNVKGRVAATVRFDPGFVELAGVRRGMTNVKKVDGGGAELTSLPADTVGALQVSGGAQLIDGAWPDLKKALDTAAGDGSDVQSMLESQLGIKLPDDLKVLLGKSFTLALPEQDFGSQLPTVGLKVTGTDAKRASEVLTSIEDVSGGAFTLDKKVDSDRLYVATTPGYADTLSQGGKLGDSDAFKTAIGDTAAMTTGLYVDLDRIEKYYLPQVGSEAHDAVQALRAVGLNVSAKGDGEDTFSLRVVGN